MGHYQDKAEAEALQRLGRDSGRASLDAKMRKEGFVKLATVTREADGSLRLPAIAVPNASRNSRFIGDGRYSEVVLVQEEDTIFGLGGDTYVLYGKPRLAPGEFWYRRADGTMEVWTDSSLSRTKRLEDFRKYEYDLESFPVKNKINEIIIKQDYLPKKSELRKKAGYDDPCGLLKALARKREEAEKKLRASREESKSAETGFTLRRILKETERRMRGEFFE